MCILLYVKLLGCNSLTWIYGQLGGPSDMCICIILLYVKLSGCNGVSWIFDLLVGGLSAMGICIIQLYVKLTGCNSFAWIYAWLEGLSDIGIYALCYMWNLFGVMVLHRSMLIWRRGWGQSAIGICAFFYICNWLSVMMLHRSMLIWQRGGIHLPWVYVHSAIYETYWV